MTAFGKVYILCLALLSRFWECEAADRPLIGILSQPGHPAPDGFSYIAASYVKQIEASGARAVPIECTLSEAAIQKKLKAVNGVVIPGGGQILKPGHSYYDAANQIVKFSKNASEHGDYFPVHGVCLGLEVLSVILSSPFNTSILGKFDAENFPSPVTLTGEAAQSRMFAAIDSSLQDDMQKESITMQNHINGLEYEGYLRNSGLRDLFQITSLSTDRNGKLYVSSMESPKFPITATQFHPEKNAFEWTTRLNIPHTPKAIEVTHAFGNFIVSEARKNSHKPESLEEENQLLISNSALIFTAAVRAKGVETDFDECYFFPKLKTQ